MPRIRLRKTERGRCDLKNYEDAYDEVKRRGSSLRAAAELHGVNRISLFRYIRKRDRACNKDSVRMGYVAHNKVFTVEQEQQLSKYIICRAKKNIGLSPEEVRKLAYEITSKYNIKRPPSWVKNKKAGEEWFLSFMERNPSLCVHEVLPNDNEIVLVTKDATVPY